MRHWTLIKSLCSFFFASAEYENRVWCMWGEPWLVSKLHPQPKRLLYPSNSAVKPVERLSVLLNPVLFFNCLLPIFKKAPGSCIILGLKKSIKKNSREIVWGAVESLPKMVNIAGGGQVLISALTSLWLTPIDTSFSNAIHWISRVVDLSAYSLEGA